MSFDNRHPPIGHPAVGHITSYPARAVDVTPDDDNDLDHPGIVCALVAGNVSVIPAQSASAVVFYVPAGGRVPCVVRRVRDTDTTATGLVLVY